MSDQPSLRPRAPRSPGGRAVVFGLFAVVAAWSTVAIVGSVSVELYASPPQQLDAAQSFRERSWCVRRLAGLRDELEAEVALEIGSGQQLGDRVARFASWNAAWNVDFAKAAERCRRQTEALAAAFAKLDAMHSAYVDGTERIIVTRSEIADQLDAAIKHLLPNP